MFPKCLHSRCRKEAEKPRSRSLWLNWPWSVTSESLAQRSHCSPANSSLNSCLFGRPCHHQPPKWLSLGRLLFDKDRGPWAPQLWTEESIFIEQSKLSLTENSYILLFSWTNTFILICLIFSYVGSFMIKSILLFLLLRSPLLSTCSVEFCPYIL